MSKGTVIGIRNVVIGCILFPVVDWILKAIFGSVPSAALGFVVMTVMVMEAAEEAFRAGKNTPHAEASPSANKSVQATP